MAFTPKPNAFRVIRGAVGGNYSTAFSNTFFWVDLVGDGPTVASGVVLDGGCVWSKGPT